MYCGIPLAKLFKSLQGAGGHILWLGEVSYPLPTLLTLAVPRSALFYFLQCVFVLLGSLSFHQLWPLSFLSLFLSFSSDFA